jgi:hypothetical protein
MILSISEVKEKAAMREKNSLALLNRLPRTQPSLNNAGRFLSI